MIQDTAPISTDSPAEPAVKKWRAGTLTYTKAGLAILFFWLLWGDFAWSMKERALGTGVLQLVLKKFHSSDTFTGLLSSSLPAIVSMIVVPIVGYKSDRHRGHWGRRIPFLMATTPVTVVGLVCLAFSPQLGAALNQALGKYAPGFDSSVLLCICLSWLVFELAALTITSLFNALVNDVVPHEFLGRFYGLFRALSLIAGIIFNHWMFGMVESYFAWIFIGVAALYAVGITMMCLNVKEDVYPTPVPMDRGRDVKGFPHATKTYFQECFGSSYYCLYFIAVGLSWQIMPPAIFTIFYAKALHMSLDTFGNCLALTYVFSLALAYPLGALVDRFHPLRVVIFTQMLLALVYLWSGLFIRDVFTFGVASVATGVLAGCWLTASASLGQRLLPKAEFAQFASAAGMVTAILTALCGPAVGLFLDNVVNHDYRFIFYICFGADVSGLICNFFLHRRFMKLGGPKNYVAPEFGGEKAPI